MPAGKALPVRGFPNEFRVVDSGINCKCPSYLKFIYYFYFQFLMFFFLFSFIYLFIYLFISVRLPFFVFIYINSFVRLPFFLFQFLFDMFQFYFILFAFCVMLELLKIALLLMPSFLFLCITSINSFYMLYLLFSGCACT